MLPALALEPSRLSAGRAPDDRSAHGAGRSARAWLVLGLAIALGAIWLAVRVSPPIMSGDGRLFFGLWRTRDLALALGLSWAALTWLVCRSSRRARTGWLAAHAVLCLCALALEAAGRARLLDFPRLFQIELDRPPGGGQAANQSTRGRALPDIAERTGFPAAPIEFEYVTDRFGWRNDVDRERADVYLLGDSFLVGGLVAAEELCSKRLEALLARPVMNCAKVGLAVQESSRQFLAQPFDLDGALVVQFVFEGNDLLDSAVARGGAPAVPPAPPGFAHNALLWLQRLTQPRPAWLRLHIGRFGEREILFHWLTQSHRGLDQELAAITSCLEEERAAVEARKASFLVVLIPTKYRVLGNLCRFDADSPLNQPETILGPLPHHLEAWAARTQCAYLDLTAHLIECASAGALPWFEADTHWNAAGHACAAERLAKDPAVQSWRSRER